jgi:DNA replication and repair protein RecF
MRSLTVRSLSVRGFRNLASVDVELGERFNVLAGDNGQGKTNLLESVYVVATSRSFRTSRLADLVMAGGTTASIRASVIDGADVREQTIGVRAGLRVVRVDGQRPVTLAAYAVRTPMVVFHPGAVALVAGGGTERRRLLDRIALYQTPSSMVDAKEYVQALRARQRVLESRGDRAADLDGWEDIIVTRGLAVTEARAAASERVIVAAQQAFSRIGPPGLPLQARYDRASPASPEVYRQELARQRARDRSRGSASTGPHRDELTLQIGEHRVRGMASQGQQRAVVLALRLAEGEVIADVTGVRPILLLDDVSSELDRKTTMNLFSRIRENAGQILMTTTRPEVIDAAGLLGGEERADFLVSCGRITRA